LYAIGAIAILASANALSHSYAGLYDWAVHHRLAGWQAMSWPAEIDVFLGVGELALYVAYLDAWPARQRIWPWATALIGLGVSVAGNIGHIQAGPGHPVILADRLTAATSPLAAFAGLTIGLLVLKVTRQQAPHGTGEFRPEAHEPGQPATPDRRLALTSVPADPTARSPGRRPIPAQSAPVNKTVPAASGTSRRPRAGAGDRHALLREADLIWQTATASGERVSQRALARQLRAHGRQFSNEHLHAIAASIGLTSEKAA